MTVIFLLHTKGGGWGFPNLSCPPPTFLSNLVDKVLSLDENSAYLTRLWTRQSDYQFKLLGGTASESGGIAQAVPGRPHTFVLKYAVLLTSARDPSLKQLPGRALRLLLV